MAPPPKHTSDFDVADTVRFREEVWAKLGELVGGQAAMKEMCVARKVDCAKLFDSLFEKAKANASGVIAVQTEVGAYKGIIRASLPVFVKAAAAAVFVILSLWVGGREVAKEAAKQVISKIEADYALPAKGVKAETGEQGKEGQ